MTRAWDQPLSMMTRSACFAQFCALVYGTTGLRFGMVGPEEDDAFVALADLAPGRRFVDLGCGWGALTAQVADRTGATGLGLDVAASVIAHARATYAQRADLDFEVADFDLLPPLRADAVLAADTLYFARDLPSTLAAIRRALEPDGRLVVAWTAPDATTLQATRLDQALSAAALSVRAVHDATDGSRAFWRRSLEACLSLEAAWREEDVARFEAMRDEAARSLEALEAGRARRWLVAATPTRPT